MIADVGAKTLDAVLYGVAVTAATTVACGLVVLATGGGWVALKVALFLVGFLLFSYGSLRLWLALSPTGPDDDGERVPVPRDRSPFESALARAVPPLDAAVPVEQRLSPAVKVVVAGLFVLGLSLALEVVFGVGVE